MESNLPEWLLDIKRNLAASKENEEKISARLTAVVTDAVHLSSKISAAKKVNRLYKENICSNKYTVLLKPLEVKKKVYLDALPDDIVSVILSYLTLKEIHLHILYASTRIYKYITSLSYFKLLFDTDYSAVQLYNYAAISILNDLPMRITTNATLINTYYWKITQHRRYIYQIKQLFQQIERIIYNYSVKLNGNNEKYSLDYNIHGTLNCLLSMQILTTSSYNPINNLFVNYSTNMNYIELLISLLVNKYEMKLVTYVCNIIANIVCWENMSVVDTSTKVAKSTNHTLANTSVNATTTTNTAVNKSLTSNARLSNLRIMDCITNMTIKKLSEYLTSPSCTVQIITSASTKITSSSDIQSYSVIQGVGNKESCIALVNICCPDYPCPPTATNTNNAGTNANTTSASADTDNITAVGGGVNSKDEPGKMNVGALLYLIHMQQHHLVLVNTPLRVNYTNTLDVPTVTTITSDRYLHNPTVAVAGVAAAGAALV